MRFVFHSEALCFIFANTNSDHKMVAFFQELLALEERIGNVNTGLSEEAVIKLLKQRKFSSWRLKASLDHEPCCICQVFHILLSLSELIPSSVGRRYFSQKQQAAWMLLSICILFLYWSDINLGLLNDQNIFDWTKGKWASHIWSCEVVW